MKFDFSSAGSDCVENDAIQTHGNKVQPFPFGIMGGIDAVYAYCRAIVVSMLSRLQQPVRIDHHIAIKYKEVRSVHNRGELLQA
jgi:hypothetical protein